jgi:hypothetical protein
LRTWPNSRKIPTKRLIKTSLAKNQTDSLNAGRIKRRAA